MLNPLSEGMRCLVWYTKFWNDIKKTFLPFLSVSVICPIIIHHTPPRGDMIPTLRRLKNILTYFSLFLAGDGNFEIGNHGQGIFHNFLRGWGLPFIFGSRFLKITLIIIKWYTIHKEQQGLDTYHQLQKTSFCKIFKKWPLFECLKIISTEHVGN
jgi:hypothetical protein